MDVCSLPEQLADWIWLIKYHCLQKFCTIFLEPGGGGICTKPLNLFKDYRNLIENRPFGVQIRIIK